MAADVDPGTLTREGRHGRQSMPGEPRRRPADAEDVDADRDGQPGDEDEEQPGRLAKDGHASYRSRMCRSIKTLRRPGEAATTGELEAAARQYVRKLSGYREPSARNQLAFDAAIAEIAEASHRLIEAIGVDVEDGPNRWVGRDGVVHTGA
jgi:hypothetical protein